MSDVRVPPPRRLPFLHPEPPADRTEGDQADVATRRSTLRGLWLAASGTAAPFGALELTAWWRRRGGRGTGR